MCPCSVWSSDLIWAAAQSKMMNITLCAEPFCHLETATASGSELTAAAAAFATGAACKDTRGLMCLKRGCRAQNDERVRTKQLSGRELKRSKAGQRREER